MTEKLYKCHCHVSGHGTRCEVAQDKKKGKKELSKLRRRLYNKKGRRYLLPDVGAWEYVG